MLNRGDILLGRRAIERRVKKAGIHCLGTLGRHIPFPLRVKLAKSSTKLGLLLAREGEFTLNGYLGELKVTIDASSGTDRAIVRGNYEPEMFAAIERFVAPGDVCADVGANTGAISLALCKRIGPRGKAYLFEPGPPFFRRLLKNLELNPRFRDVAVAEQLGVSEASGELYWEEDPEFPGNAYLFGSAGTRVPVVTLDEYFGSDFPRLDFIKIDVEGMELEVLRGAERTIERLKPKIVFETIMSFETFRRAPIRREAEAFLRSLGYELFSMRADGATSPVRYPDFGVNTLALPVKVEAR